MDICFASHRYAPMIGGYENQLRLLAESLSKSFNIKVLTFNLNTNSDNEFLSGVEVFRVRPQITLFRVPLAYDYLSTLKRIKFDVLHAHGFIPVVSDLTLFQAKKNKKASLYTHHFDGNVQDSVSLNLVANLYNKVVGKSCINLADAIVATSKTYAQTSSILEGYLDKLRFIPCAVDCNIYAPQLPSKILQVKQRLRLNGKKVILFVGRIVPYKGLEYLIKACEYINAIGEDFCLLIIGGQEGRRITDASIYYQKIFALANSDSIKGKVLFLGMVDSCLLPVYYSLADVVVLPSVMRGEAFGSVLLESLACGTPIVATTLPGVQEVLKGNNLIGRYVSPKNAHALANAVIQMCYNKPRISAQCRTFAVENYSIESISKQYASLYLTLGSG